MTDKTRNRRTRKEMIELRRQQLEKLLAEEEGRIPSSESGVLKALRNRLRKTKTALKAARMTLEGVRQENGDGWHRPPIDEKIEHTKQRLASQIETRDRAEEHRAALPGDVERLEALVEAATAGQDVEFPKDLTPLTPDEERTDEEHETAFLAKASDESEEN
jgi:hypothetical protein